MAWVTPRTWVKGDFPTVGRLNTDLRDNMLFLGTVLGARVHPSAVQSVNSGVATVVNSWDTEDFDSDTLHNQSALFSRLTIVTAGKYLISGGAQWGTAAPAGQKRVDLIRNRATVDTTICRNHERNLAAENAAVFVESIDDALAGDYYRIEAFQDTTVAMNFGIVTTSPIQNFILAHRICA
jgi:hypothetical protein